LPFILAGISKITGSETVLAHVAQHHVPGALLPLVVVLEIGAGMALFSGWFVRPAALLLSGFCLGDGGAVPPGFRRSRRALDVLQGSGARRRPAVAGGKCGGDRARRRWRRGRRRADRQLDSAAATGILSRARASRRRSPDGARQRLREGRSWR
jgi:DoxX